MPNTYPDLQIRIRAWNEAKGYHPVEADTDDGAHFDGAFKLDDQALTALEYNSEGYGRALFDALFTGDILAAYNQAVGKASQLKEARLRVRLWIDDDAAELHARPWERLYHRWLGRFIPLATSTATPFSRYTGLETREPAPVLDRPLRVLVAIANPKNLPAGLSAVPVEQEVAGLREGLSAMVKTNQVQVTLMPGQAGLSPELETAAKAGGWTVLTEKTTLENVARKLPGTHIFHFIGHGAFNRPPGQEHGPGETVLYLEKDDGGFVVTKDRELVTRLAAIGNPPHLVFLMSCETSRRDPNHPWVGLGPQLVQSGVPAVVAMQKQIPISMSRPFTTEFYRRLVEHGLVDQAISEARLGVYKADSSDWAIPVLFMRLKTGALFVEETTLIPSEKAPTNIVNTVYEGGVNFGNIGGSVNIGGKVVGRDDNSTVVNNYGSGEASNSKSWVVLELQLKKVRKQIDALSIGEGDKDDLKDNVDKIEAEVKKGESADLTRLKRLLRNVGDISGDILQATIKGLTNVAAGVPEAVKDAAEKARG